MFGGFERDMQKFIDLERQHQPLHSETGTSDKIWKLVVWLVILSIPVARLITSR